jgi:outer membrane protein assembly factor BamB
MVAAAAAVVLTGIAALALALPATPPSLLGLGPAPDAEEVALPEPGELPGPRDGDSGGEDGADEPPDQPQPAEAGVPPALRCGDDDCERWWRPYLQGPVYSVWRDADQVLVAMEDRLAAWDAATGADRWERMLPSQLVLGPDRLGGGSWRPPQILGRDGRLVLLAAGGFQVLTGSGEVRWTAVLENEIPVTATMTGEQLVVLTEEDEPAWAFPVDEDEPEPAGSVTTDEPTDVTGTNGPPDPDEPAEPVEAPPDVQEPRLAISAFDLETGELRWRRDDLPMFLSFWFQDGATPDVVVVQDGSAAVALDASTGTERYRLEGALDGDVLHVGTFLLRTAPAAAGDGQGVVVHAADDGRELVALRAQVIDTALVVDDLLVAVVHPGPDHDASGDPTRRDVEVLAVDLAGTVVWRVPVDSVPSASCCASVLDAGDGLVRVAAGPGAAASHLDVRTGRVERIEPVTGSTDREEWPFGRDLVVSHRSSGRETTLRLARGVQPVTALGGFVQPVLGGDGRSTVDDLLLLRTDSGLVAVEVPPAVER